MVLTVAEKGGQRERCINCARFKALDSCGDFGLGQLRICSLGEKGGD